MVHRPKPPEPVFINKVLLEHDHAHLFIYCLCHSRRAELSISTETIWPRKPKMFICLFIEKKILMEKKTLVFHGTPCLLVTSRNTDSHTPDIFSLA